MDPAPPPLSPEAGFQELEPPASPFSVPEWPTAIRGRALLSITTVFILNSYSNYFVVKIYFFPKTVMRINEVLKNPLGLGRWLHGLVQQA